MKILYFHQHFSTPDGATSTRSYEMARRMIQRGHQVTMVCGSGFMTDTGLLEIPRKGLRRGRVAGIDVIEICLPYSNYDSLFKRAMTFLKFALKSIQLALREDFNLLYATSTPLTAAIPGIVMKLLKPGKKFVFEVRDLWPELPKAMGVVTHPLVLGGLRALEQFAYLAMDAGVALSPGIRRGMRTGGGRNKRIAMVPNGCDISIFQEGKTDERDTPIAIKTLPLMQDKGLRCIFTGAHGIANGLDAVLDAAAVLKAKKRPDIQLVFVGDGKLKPRLMQRAAAEGLDNCRFLDPMPKLKVAQLLQKVDVGLMILDNVPAFYYGTSPNKFFDYIACGLPVLNNYPGWLADLITRNACGVAVAPGDPHAFAAALVELADHPEQRRQMGKNARKLAETEFSRDLLAKRLVLFLEEVAGREAAARSAFQFIDLVE